MTYSGNCHLGDLFSSRREKGVAGLPTLSVTLNDGLVKRDDLDRKQETNLTPEEHLQVKQGDIVYNMMRMWQGAFGLADCEGLVSPAYVVLTPREGIDPLYASYLFKTKRMLHLFWAYSYGLTDDRLRLYFPDFARIPATIHGLSEQRKRAKTLSALDAVISQNIKLQENTKAVKMALLTKLLKPHAFKYPVGWEEAEFGEFVELVRVQFDPKVSAVQRWCVELEHIEQGTGRLAGSTTTTEASSTKLAFQAGDVLFGKLRPYLQKFWLAECEGVCSSEIWVLRPNRNRCLPEFLACLLQSAEFMRAVNASAGSKMPRADWDFVERTPLLLPPLGTQLEITNLLSTFDLESSNRSRYLATLKMEYSALLQRLFVVGNSGES